MSFFQKAYYLFPKKHGSVSLLQTAALLSGLDPGYLSSQTDNYLIVSVFNFANGGILKHTVVLKKHWTFSKIPRDVFEKTTVCFFRCSRHVFSPHFNPKNPWLRAFFARWILATERQ